MTLEQAQKHGEVIKWWIDNLDSGVFRRANNGSWTITKIPFFDVDIIYIQNDEYAEFRKALVDGKTLEYTEDNGKTWFNHCDTLDTWYYPKHIRIKLDKHDEQEFKEGDWVYITLEQGTTSLRQFKECMNEWTNVYRITKWKPKDEELCVFWDNNDKTYTIGKYSETFIKENKIYYICNGIIYNNIAPLEFVETLKDK